MDWAKEAVRTVAGARVSIRLMPSRACCSGDRLCSVLSGTHGSQGDWARGVAWEVCSSMVGDAGRSLPVITCLPGRVQTRCGDGRDKSAWKGRGVSNIRRGGGGAGLGGDPCGRPWVGSGTGSHAPPTGDHKGPRSASTPLPPLRRDSFLSLPFMVVGCETLVPTLSCLANKLYPSGRFVAVDVSVVSDVFGVSEVLVVTLVTLVSVVVVVSAISEVLVVTLVVVVFDVSEVADTCSCSCNRTAAEKG